MVTGKTLKIRNISIEMQKKKKVYTTTKWNSSQDYKNVFKFPNHINKGKTHMIVLVDREKVFDKIRPSLKDKNIQQSSN